MIADTSLRTAEQTPTDYRELDDDRLDPPPQLLPQSRRRVATEAPRRDELAEAWAGLKTIRCANLARGKVQWVAGQRYRLPPGAWQRCAGDARVYPGERVWLGVDVGGERSASAVVWVTQDLRVDCAVFHGDAAVLDCAAKVRELAEEFSIAEVIYDPWRFNSRRSSSPTVGSSPWSSLNPTRGWARRPRGCTPPSSRAGYSTRTIRR